MIPIFFDQNALFIGGLRTGIPAATLTAVDLQDGAGGVAVMSVHSSDPLVLTTFDQIEDVNGAGFSDPTTCVRYLNDQFRLRFPVGDLVTVRVAAVDGQTVFNLEVPPQTLSTVRLVVNGQTYYPPDITASDTTVAWQGPFALSATDAINLVYS